MKYFVIFFLLLSAGSVFAHPKIDSVHGLLIKQITAPAHFVSFDKKYPDHAFMRNESTHFLSSMAFTVPEMDCFLANHAKEDLQITYEIREVNDTAKKKTEHVNYLIRIVSLKTGDDTNTWAEKEKKDPKLLAAHHEELRKVRGD